MKLKRYNATNTKAMRIGKPTIRFYKQGQIHISPATIKIMGLSEKETIEFVQNEENPLHWFIVKSDKEKGLSMRVNPRSKDLVINNSFIAKKIIESLKVDTSKKPNINCLVATKPTIIDKEKLFKIKTKSAS